MTYTEQAEQTEQEWLNAKNEQDALRLGGKYKDQLIDALETLARVEAVRTFRLLDVEPGEVLQIEKLVRYEDVQKALEGKQ